MAKQTTSYGTAKVRGKLVQQAHWANEISVEEHEHVVIKLASDFDSSSGTGTVFSLRAYEVSLYWILIPVCGD